MTRSLLSPGKKREAFDAWFDKNTRASLVSAGNVAGAKEERRQLAEKIAGVLV